MENTANIRRRNRLKRHYTMTSNVLIFGYQGKLTDAEKLTYQSIDSFDWPDGGGERKGYAYPSIATLARLRGVSERSIQRHLESLEKVGLLSREVRPGKPNFLWIEEPSAEECERYLSTIGERGDTDGTPRNATDVTPYKKEEREENKPVNESQRLWEQKGRRERLTELEKAKRDWLANHMAEQLHDSHSFGFYRKTAATVPEARVFEALSEVRTIARQGRVTTSRAALFVTLVLRQQREEVIAD